MPRTVLSNGMHAFPSATAVSLPCLVEKDAALGYAREWGAQVFFSCALCSFCRASVERFTFGRGRAMAVEGSSEEEEGISSSFFVLLAESSRCSFQRWCSLADTAMRTSAA